MIRIALLGSDSTHTEAFASLVNGPDAPLRELGRVVSIWGEDRSETAAKAEKLGIEKVCGAPEQALENADFAMVIGRFADAHPAPARVALTAGLPVFVDKPFTVTRSEGLELAELAVRSGARLCSASPLRFAPETAELKRAVSQGTGPAVVVTTAPANCTDLGDDPRLDTAAFYGVHAVEILLEVFQDGMWETEVRYRPEDIRVDIAFPDRGKAVLHLIRDLPELYTLDAYGPAGALRRQVTLDGGYYLQEMQFLLERFALGRGGIDVQATCRGIALLGELDRDDPFRGAGRVE